MKNDRVFRMDSLRLFMNCDPFLAEKENICFKYILYLASYRSLLKIVLLIYRLGLEVIGGSEFEDGLRLE